jgi:large subunit ribosomal protein L6e
VGNQRRPGPFKFNGVPLRRVNQAYTIATSTKVDVSGIDVSSFDDAFFTKSAKAQKKGDFIDGKKQVHTGAFWNLVFALAHA